MKESKYLTVNKISDGDKLTLELTGALDANTAHDLEKFLKKSLDGVSALVFDMTGVEYVSSAGLRLLLFAKKKMSSKGSMKVVGVGEAIIEIFDITGFTDLLNIE